MTMFPASDVHCQLRASCESTTIPAPSHEIKHSFSMTEVCGEDPSIIPILPGWMQSPKVLKYPIPRPLILGMSTTCGLYPC